MALTFEILYHLRASLYEFRRRMMAFNVIQKHFSPFDNDTRLSDLSIYGKHVDKEVCNPNVYATWFGLRKLCAVVSEIRSADFVVCFLFENSNTESCLSGSVPAETMRTTSGFALHACLSSFSEPCR
jgi:hypothetical protein